MALPPRVEQAVGQLLALFASGNVPQALAHATYPRLNVPSSRWSFRNRLLMLLSGTEDARGFRQWREVGRSVTKGAKAVWILAPVCREEILCPGCGKRLFLTPHETLEVCPLCDGSLADASRKRLLLRFRAIPVFRREDTEGAPLEDELLPVPRHNFLALAERWGVSVKTQGFNGTAYGSFSPGQQTIVLSSPDPEIFYHELAHAAHARLRPLKPGQDAGQEIVAEFVAATLAALDGRTAHLGTSYEYLTAYAERMRMPVERAVFSLLGEIENVLKIIVD